MPDFWSIVLNGIGFLIIVAFFTWPFFLIIPALTRTDTEDQDAATAGGSAQAMKKAKLKGLNFNSKDSVYDAIGGIGGFGWSG